MWNMIGRRVAHIPKVNNKESKKFKNEVVSGWVGSLFVVVLGTEQHGRALMWLGSKSLVSGLKVQVRKYLGR